MEGNFSFWFHNWFGMGPLVDNRSKLTQLKLKVNDCWEWNTTSLTSLVGEDKAMEIRLAIVGCKQGWDMVIWKPNQDGYFSTASTWD